MRRFVPSLLLVLCVCTNVSCSFIATPELLLSRHCNSYQPQQQLLLPCPLYAAAGGKASSKKKDRTVAVNRVAYRNYEVLESLEAGIVLTGTEVKAVRSGKMNLRDGFVKPSKDGRSCTLLNVHIGKHEQAGEYFQHKERRERVLLVHTHEALKLKQKTEYNPGMTVVPLKAYFNEKNILKLQIAICRGKNVRDKRATIKEREAKREENRMIKTFRL